MLRAAQESIYLLEDLFLFRSPPRSPIRPSWLNSMAISEKLAFRSSVQNPAALEDSQISFLVFSQERAIEQMALFPSMSKHSDRQVR